MNLYRIDRLCQQVLGIAPATMGLVRDAESGEECLVLRIPADLPASLIQLLSEGVARYTPVGPVTVLFTIRNTVLEWRIPPTSGSASSAKASQADMG